MYFNARWLDVSLGRFAQADTIVPPGVQGLDRYSYVNNSPMNYVDPSGHFTCSNDRNSDDYCPGKPSSSIGISSGRGVEGGVVSAGGRGEDRDGKGQGLNVPVSRISPIAPPPCPFCADAALISFSYSAGSNTNYVSYGFDIVITSDEVGLFFINGRGIELGKYERDPILPATKMEDTYMFPQISATVYVGQIWGDPLNESILNYQGPAIIEGGSLGPISGEYFESVNSKTGIPNGDIHGLAIGGGYSVIPGEGHKIYTNAYPIFSFGY